MKMTLAIEAAPPRPRVSDFRAPPFAPRVWFEADHIVMLFNDGQAIRVPSDEPARFIRYLQREELRHRTINKDEDWLLRWSLASQEKMAEVRAAAERQKTADAMRASRRPGPPESQTTEADTWLKDMGI
jgi:hypothetical protein